MKFRICYMSIKLKVRKKNIQCKQKSVNTKIIKSCKVVKQTELQKRIKNLTVDQSFFAKIVNS